MYKDFFLLNEMPFSIAPDPRFLFMSERHCEAMAHLLYGVQGDGGIVLLTGEVGTGKTTICRSLIDQIPENIDVAFILNPSMSVEELLQTICEELHIEVDSDHPGIKTYIDALNVRLLSAHAQGRRVILIVDEAQDLDSKVLEQLRLLTNLETNTRKLLQIFLIGQPELLSMLARPELRQVSQRVIARYHLTHLSQSEVSSYVAHRLRISGASPLIFPEKLIKQVYRASGGVPRLINLICDRALLGAYVLRSEQITKPILRNAVEEVLPAQSPQLRTKVLFATLFVLVVTIVFMYYSRLNSSKPSGTKSVFENSQTSSSSVVTKLPIVASVPVISKSSSQQPSSLPISTFKVPNSDTVGESEMLAFQSLFILYGIHIDTQSIEAPCRQAETQGMRCFSGYGGLSDLLHLDQPVVMHLRSSDGKEYWGTLISLDHQTANLKIAGVEKSILFNDLATEWFGHYIAILDSPPDYNGRMTVKYHGPSVNWLRQTMETVDGVRDNGSDEFDEELAKRIRQFQLSDGIQPDGLVGPLTLIRLNVRSGKTKPRLATELRG